MEILEFLLNLITMSWRLLKSPWTSLDGLWIVLPLVLIMVLIQFYFGRHRSEELGWNSAFGNAISLLWICVILWKFLIVNYSFGEPLINKFFLMIALSLLVFALLFCNFFHILPKKFAFVVSSDTLYILGYISISFVIGRIEITWFSILSAAVLFFAFFYALELLTILVPMTKSAKQVVKRREKKGKK